MILLIFAVFGDFRDVLVTPLILGVQWLVMACYWSTMRRGGAYCKLE